MKGIEEVGLAARPRAAAEMVLVRLCHAADLPTPDEAIRTLQGNGPAAPAPSPTQAAPPRASSGGGGARPARTSAAPRLETEVVSAPSSKPELTLRSFDDVIAKAKAERDRLLVFALERHVRPVRFEPGQIEIALTEDAEPGLPQKLMQTLKAWTGERWMVAVSKDADAQTAHEARQMSEASLFDQARADPLVQKVLQRFPGAEIVSVRERGVQAEAEPERIDDIPSGETEDEA